MNLFVVICIAVKSVRFKIVVCDKQRSDYQDLSYNPAQKYFRQLIRLHEIRDKITILERK